MSTKKKNSLDIAILGISAALVIVLQALAEGLRIFGLPLSLALGLIPVLVVAQLRGWRTGLILGVVFGLTSFVIGIIQLGGLEGAQAVAFNPLVTVLPRALVGMVVGCIATLTAASNKRRKDKLGDVQEKPFRKFSREYVQSALATLAGVLTNTIGFLGMFYAFGKGMNLGGTVVDFKYILTAVVAVNTVVEAASYVVIVPAIVHALRKAKLIYKDLAAESALSQQSAWQLATKHCLPVAVSAIVLALALVIALATGLVICLK